MCNIELFETLLDIILVVKSREFWKNNFSKLWRKGIVLRVEGSKILKIKVNLTSKGLFGGIQTNSKASTDFFKFDSLKNSTIEAFLTTSFATSSEKDF